MQIALKAMIISANETDFAAGLREMEESNRMREHVLAKGERECERCLSKYYFSQLILL